MLLRQDRFHIHPILCAKIVQGERKRKELVHFLFPSRSLYYQKIVQGERRAKQIYLILPFRTGAAAYIISH